ncbi:MAG: ATP phosphoribosyltransferase regulatory subunit [Rhodobacteraceae bacterium]|jgi:ATP phosphoribosyltransferase regulatory subunit|nr:ATP phosphoribosyltransferase regulatory subunit [Paracoccaceae bacterium]
MPDAPTREAERTRAEALIAPLLAEGARRVDTDILLPAATLLDLYGEDIRARAYITTDPAHGEQVLRPDFTVPVVQAHMAHGADPARYAYLGPVFRRQEGRQPRPREYLQVGYEVFDRTNPAAADAEVFALFRDTLAHLPVRAATGDIGILMAAVRSLRTSDARRAALMRHIWRPRRFRALLDRYAGRTPVPPARAAMLASPDPFAGAGPDIGRRTRAEVTARIDALRADALEPPISAEQVDALEDLASFRGTMADALMRFRDAAVDMRELTPAIRTFEARMTALAARGIDPERMDFEASFGRTTLEYYDGFVFGFLAEGRSDLPPVATGGRYDALTRVLGNGRSIPAVGGVIRPAVVLALETPR